MNPDPFPPGLGPGTPPLLYCSYPVPFTCSEPMAKVFVCQCPKSQVSSIASHWVTMLSLLVVVVASSQRNRVCAVYGVILYRSQQKVLQRILKHLLMSCKSEIYFMSYYQACVVKSDSSLLGPVFLFSFQN